MTLPQIKSYIKDDITSKYEEYRDLIITYVVNHAKVLKTYREELKNTPQTNEDGSENEIWRELYTGFYGYYNKETKKQEIGTFYRDIPKKYHGMCNQSEKYIIEYYTNECKKDIKNMVDKIYSEIKQYKPTSISLGNSEHDINFVLDFKDNNKKSFTINTIVASGLVQAPHCRTLIKLHKKEV